MHSANTHCIPTVCQPGEGGSAVEREGHSNEGNMASQLLKSGHFLGGEGTLSGGEGGREETEAKQLALFRGWKIPSGQSGQQVWEGVLEVTSVTRPPLSLLIYAWKLL